MTLVLKSDKTLDANVPSLGDKHGIVGPTDWNLMLDFESQQYVKKNGVIVQNLQLGEVIKCDRDTAANIISADNSYELVGVNTPRLSKNFTKTRRGLLIEANSTNVFTNSNAPVSQSFPITNAGDQYFIARIKGSGSIAVQSSILVEQLGSGTENSPIMFKISNPASNSTTVNVTVTGNVEYASVEATTTGFFKQRSLIETGVKSFGRGFDKLSAMGLSAANQTSYTVLFQCLQSELTDTNMFNMISQPLFQIGSSDKHYAITTSKPFGQPKELRFRSFDMSEKGVSVMGGVKQDSTIAICVTPNGFRIAMDGKVSEVVGLVKNIPLSTFKLGISDWTGLSSRADGCFTKLAIYDRALSVSELEKVTLSFK